MSFVCSLERFVTIRHENCSLLCGCSNAGCTCFGHRISPYNINDRWEKVDPKGYHLVKRALGTPEPGSPLGQVRQVRTQVWTRYRRDTSLDPILVGHKSGPNTGGTQVWTQYRWDTSLDPIQVGHKSGPDTGGTHAHVIIVLVWLWLMLHNHVVYCYVRFDGWCVLIKGPSIIVNIFPSVQTVH